jgi:hypothetical protein
MNSRTTPLGPAAAVAAGSARAEAMISDVALSIDTPVSRVSSTAILRAAATFSSSSSAPPRFRLAALRNVQDNSNENENKSRISKHQPLCPSKSFFFFFFF